MFCHSQICPLLQPGSSSGVGGSVTPIFTKQKVNFQPTSPITHLVVANNQLVVALANKTLLRIDLLHPESPHGMMS